VGVTVAISHPAFPDGTEFGINHLGVVPNNGTLDVPEENEAAFVNAYDLSVADAFANIETVTVSGTSDVPVPPPGTGKPFSVEQQEAPPQEGEVS
jgi:hypothetical protein